MAVERVAVIDPAAGASGDMFLGALVECGLGADWLTDLPRRLALDDQVRIIVEPVDRAGIRARICDDAGNVRRFVNIFLADEDIRHLQSLDTKVGGSDEISIVPAIAGG